MTPVGNDDAGTAAGGVDDVAGVGKHPNVAQLIQDVPDRPVALVGAEIGIVKLAPPVQADGSDELPGAADRPFTVDVANGDGGDLPPAEGFNHRSRAQG